MTLCIHPFFCFKCSFLKIISGYILFVLFAISVKFTFLYIVPSTYWVRYDGISFESHPTAGKNFNMVSYSKWERKTNVRWEPTLFCSVKEGGPFIYQGSKTIERDGYYPKEEYVRYWDFIQVPENVKHCYVEVYTSINAGLGIHKTFSIKTPIVAVDEG